MWSWLTLVVAGIGVWLLVRGLRLILDPAVRERTHARRMREDAWIGRVFRRTPGLSKWLIDTAWYRASSPDGYRAWGWIAVWFGVCTLFALAAGMVASVLGAAD